MPTAERVGGIIYVKIDGATQRAKGSFTYDLGAPQRKSVIGATGVDGYSETPKAAYIEGEITDSISTDLKSLFNVTDSTVTLEVANGKTIVLRHAYYTGDGTATTEEGAVKIKFESAPAEEI
jgi:hypothetical protein